MAHQLIEAAHAQGFDLVALVPSPMPGPVEGSPSQRGGLALSEAVAHYQSWIEQGMHGTMAYLARPDALTKRLYPQDLLPGLQSILVTGIRYRITVPSPALLDDPSRGIMASYAWEDDYHVALRGKLEHVARSVLALTDQAFAYRACVDTAPILERALAAEAGLGFIGKNTCLISPRMGSWLFLGELLLALPVPAGFVTPGVPSPTPSKPLPSCGRCTRCLEACPTGALVAPHILDARRCISYLTIEHKGPVPRELRPLVGNRVFGCDLCQAVCPWNRRLARTTTEPALAPSLDSTSPRLLDLMALDDAAFSARFHSSPLRRAKRRGLLRNTAIALGNWGSPQAIPALARALSDREPLVRGHAAWALGRIGTPPARSALKGAHAAEVDPWVRLELDRAMAVLP